MKPNWTTDVKVNNEVTSQDVTQKIGVVDVNIGIGANF